MAEKITLEDQTQAPKSRPRPEVRRSVVPPPGGLPLPPSRQTTIPYSRILPESGATSIPSSNYDERSMTTDLFGLPEFKFPIASPLKTTTGKSCAGFSSIKSPTHLPGIANLMVPSLLGNFSARSGGSKQTALPKPSDFKSVLGLKSRDGFVTNAVEKLTGKDLPKRPNDLSLFKPDESVIKHFSDPVSIDRSGVDNFQIPIISKDFNKSTNTAGQVSDIAGPSTKLVKPSAVESMSESLFSAEAAINLAQGASASVHLPESSSNVESPELQDLNLVFKRSSDPTPTVPQAEPCSEMKRSGESMPIIAQHQDVLPKSKSLMDKFKRLLRRGWAFKKKGGKEDEEEYTGLVFENEEMEQERRSKTRSGEDDKKYKPFPTETYNYFLAIDPILPKGEVETKCRIVDNIPYDSPTESVVSGSSSSKSDSFITSPEESYVEESTSKSYPASPAAERTLESTPMSLSVEPPSSKSSPVSPDIERKSKSVPDAEHASKSFPVSPSKERGFESNHE